MKVSEVKIYPSNGENGLVAYASCLLDDSFVLKSMAIFDNEGELKISYPAKKLQKGISQYFYPINKEATEIMESAIFNAYEGLNKEYDYDLGGPFEVKKSSRAPR